MSERTDDVLIAWIITSFAWDVACWGMAIRAVYNGRSGWWLVLAVILTWQTTLLDVLKKRFGV